MFVILFGSYNQRSKESEEGSPMCGTWSAKRILELHKLLFPNVQLTMDEKLAKKLQVKKGATTTWKAVSGPS